VEFKYLPLDFYSVDYWKGRIEKSSSTKYEFVVDHTELVLEQNVSPTEKLKAIQALINATK
jgi:hypothetical protein